MEKNALRKDLLSLRKSLQASYLTYQDLINYKEFRDAKTVFCYVSSFGEVDTHSVLCHIASQKVLTVPYCTDNNGHMICVRITSKEDLTDGRFGILEPKTPVAFNKEEIDFAIVPGIAFDESGFRLGYGKGYYDRFLSDINPFKLGVCKKELFLEKLPHNEYDVKMDAIIKK